MRCPICSEDIHEFVSSQHLPKFFQCRKCGGYFSQSGGEVYYPEEYFSETRKSSIFGQFLHPLLTIFLDQRVRKISSLVSSRHSPRILDYGCGTGVLVERLLKNGYEVKGFEPSQSAVALAKKIHLPVYDDLKALSGSYALIMFWHSLEHTFNPREVVAWCHPLLEEKGKILIAVPNASSWEARLAGEQWFHYDYPFHRIHFTPRAITQMLENVGFRVINIDYFNPEYTFSGLVQTFLNFFLPKNILYSIVANRRMSRSRGISSFYGFVSLFALVVFSPVLVFLFFLELAAKKTGAMIVSAEKI